jgi:hypothetical protein
MGMGKFVGCVWGKNGFYLSFHPSLLFALYLVVWGERRGFGVFWCFLGFVWGLFFWFIFERALR